MRFQALSKYGGIATSANGDDDRRAVDNRRYDKARCGAVIDNVTQDAGLRRRAGDLPVDLLVIGGGDNEPHSSKQSIRKLAFMLHNPVLVTQPGELACQIARDDGNRRTSSHKQSHLAFGNHTTAYDQAGTVLQLKKDWKVIHVNHPGLRLSTISSAIGKLK